MDALHGTERVETAIIGGGQAGLATAYYLKERGRPFVILDAGDRIGDAWRTRWESLRLFTPARFDSLPGFPVPRGRTGRSRPRTRWPNTSRPMSGALRPPPFAPGVKVERLST